VTKEESREGFKPPNLRRETMCKIRSVLLCPPIPTTSSVVEKDGCEFIDFIKNPHDALFLFFCAHRVASQ